MTRLLWLPLPLLLACGGGPEQAPTSGSCRPVDTCTGDSCIGEAWSSGDFGDPCQTSAECTSAVCGQDNQTGASFCTQTCDPAAAEPCPFSAVCLLTGDGSANVCGPPVPCQ